MVKFFQIIAIDELKTDYKNPIEQCNSLNPVSFIFYSLKPSLGPWGLSSWGTVGYLIELSQKTEYTECKICAW